MKNTLLVSDSLIGSLCRELEFIKQRTEVINNSLVNCNDRQLKKRLNEELEGHKARKEEATGSNV